METYEKKYKEALERARKSHDNAHGLIKKEWVETIFPELKESEDERIRKTLLKLVNDTNGEGFWNYYQVHKEEALAWLEKQGEQKSVDKVEPKFHKGDWVIDKQGIVHQIANVVENVTNHTYGYDIVGGGYFNDNIEGVRLWTIHDAKDGDVLATKKGNPFIYDKDRYNNGLAYYYAGLDVNKELTLKSPHHMLAHFGELHSVSPATKEQRELLFQKMKEAGYEWNAEKKELKKIEQKSVEENNGNIGKTSSNCSKECEKIITASLLQNNGFIFSEERFETHECYYKELNNGVDVSLLICYGTDKWLLEIMFNNCEQELVKFVSTVEELQKCLDIMGVELKIKQEKI